MHIIQHLLRKINLNCPSFLRNCGDLPLVDSDLLLNGMMKGGRYGC